MPNAITQTWDIQYFPLDSLLLKDDLQLYNAKLYVHLPSDHGSVSTTISPNPTALDNESQENVYYGDEAWVHLYYLTIDKNTQAGRMIQTDATRVKLLADRGGWIDIDMMEILKIWLKYPNENLGLHIQVKTKSGQIIPVGIQHQITNVSELLIFLFFQPQTKCIIRGA